MPPVPGVQQQQVDYHAAVLDRARRKRESLVSGARFSPIGVLWDVVILQTVLITALVSFAALPFFLLWQSDGEANIALGISTVALSSLYLVPIFGVFRPKARSPECALKTFYKSLGKGRFKHAHKLVFEPDRDESLRYPPAVTNMGRPTGRAYSFANGLGFAEYWKSLIHTHPWPYCIAKVSDVNVQQVTPRIAVASYRLRLRMNTKFWWLLLLGSLFFIGALLLWAIMAAVLDQVTSKRVDFLMQKVLVKVGDEWRVFNGEWHGPEDVDLSWFMAGDATAR